MAGSIPRSATSSSASAGSLGSGSLGAGGSGEAAEAAHPALPERATRRGSRVRVTAAAWFAAVLLAAIVGSAILAPVIAPQDPFEQSLEGRLAPPMWMPRGSAARPLGADDLGRDILSRVLYGSRVSLLVGFTAAIIGAVVGTTLGLLSGYTDGLFSDGIMLLADAQLALPFLVLAIGMIAVVGPSLTVLIVLAGISGWTAYARVIRGMVLTLREQEFVLAARALGASTPRLLLRHICPNIISTVVVLASLQLASVILLESTLSFLGLGIQPPAASWGSMLGLGREYLNTAWWISVFPGLVLMATILSVSLGGDWLRDVLDPHLNHEQ